MTLDADLVGIMDVAGRSWAQLGAVPPWSVRSRELVFRNELEATSNFVASIGPVVPFASNRMGRQFVGQARFRRTLAHESVAKRLLGITHYFVRQVIGSPM